MCIGCYLIMFVVMLMTLYVHMRELRTLGQASQI
jgi:hypothetical protein